MELGSRARLSTVPKTGRSLDGHIDVYVEVVMVGTGGSVLDDCTRQRAVVPVGRRALGNSYWFCIRVEEA